MYIATSRPLVLVRGATPPHVLDRVSSLIFLCGHFPTSVVNDNFPPWGCDRTETLGIYYSFNDERFDQHLVSGLPNVAENVAARGLYAGARGTYKTHLHLVLPLQSMDLRGEQENRS